MGLFAKFVGFFEGTDVFEVGGDEFEFSGTFPECGGVICFCFGVGVSQIGVISGAGVALIAGFSGVLDLDAGIVGRLVSGEVSDGIVEHFLRFVFLIIAEVFEGVADSATDSSADFVDVVDHLLVWLSRWGQAWGLWPDVSRSAVWFLFEGWGGVAVEGAGSGVQAGVFGARTAGLQFPSRRGGCLVFQDECQGCSFLGGR